MSKSAREIVVLTGASGFLGFHVRALLHSMGVETRVLALGDRLSMDIAEQVFEGATTLIHLAGVNRGPDQEIRSANRRFAVQIRDAILRYGQSIRKIAYANSTQSTTLSVYGDAKREAGLFIDSLSAEIGASFSNVVLPNLYGEYGRPHYNSVVATFCHLVATGGEPTVQGERPLDLVHAQTAARAMIGDLTEAEMRVQQVRKNAFEILQDVKSIQAQYAGGQLPSMTTDYELNLFNTFRSYIPDDQRAIPLTRRADSRGSFFEVAKSHGGAGQTSFSTTNPGVTRGQHYHLRKVERFVVLSGSAEIRMRSLFDHNIHSFSVSGDVPVAIDMPTMWPHSITNYGSKPLYTMFWTNDIFDPAAPDTYAEEV